MIKNLRAAFGALFAALLVAGFLLSGSIAFAQSGDPAQALGAAKHSIQTVQEQQAQGHMSASDAKAAIQFYMDKASQAVGHPVTMEEIMAAPDPMYDMKPMELTPLQQFAGLITFANVAVVIGIIIGVISVGFLFWSYALQLIANLKNIPTWVYEVLFFLASGALIVWGWFVGGMAGTYIGFAGCLLFAVAVSFASHMRKLRTVWFRYSAILFVAWALIALLYGSSLIGFIAVGALLSALGFSFAVEPLCYAIGFRDEAAVGRATTAAFLILAIFVGLRLLGQAVPYLGIFETGALFLGSFVGYLGLLIASSKWYPHKGSYALMQVITIVAGIAALYIGSVAGIPTLQRIGGTFFVLYAIEKLMEIPVNTRRQYALLGVMIACALIGFYFFTVNNLEAMKPFLFLPG